MDLTRTLLIFIAQRKQHSNHRKQPIGIGHCKSPCHAWDVNPLQVHDDLASVGVPQLQVDILRDLPIFPCDVAVGREAVVLFRVERLHHRVITDMAQVLHGDLDEVKDAELCIAHGVILGESVMVKDFNFNRERPVCDRQGELLVPFWVDGFIFDAGLYFLLSEADDDVGVAAVGEGVADGQVQPAHHLHLEQPKQALHGWMDRSSSSPGRSDRRGCYLLYASGGE